MPSERTFVTEVATGLGMVGLDTVEDVLRDRPGILVDLGPGDWDRLDELWRRGAHRAEFAAGFANGRAFLAAPDGLNGRRPRLIEWTGARRAPGDEVVPCDLRIDHVYMVSCKYLSQILHNLSPARLAMGALAAGPVDDRRDWFDRVAPDEHQALYAACRRATGDDDLPSTVGELDGPRRRRLAEALRGGWPEGAAEAYAALCRAVAEETASRWASRVGGHNAETVLWRLLRIGSAPYFVLGSSAQGSVRLRIATPWDWRRSFRLNDFTVRPQPGGQPRVGWSARYEERSTRRQAEVTGHVEIRWSHGRFSGPPEAKVYLDSPHHDVPGYHALGPDETAGTLFAAPARATAP